MPEPGALFAGKVYAHAQLRASACVDDAWRAWVVLHTLTCYCESTFLCTVRAASVVTHCGTDSLRDVLTV